MAQARAFFRRWGQPMPSQEPLVICRGKGLHWTLQQEVTQ
jgi:hypothetical protein